MFLYGIRAAFSNELTEAQQTSKQTVKQTNNGKETFVHLNRAMHQSQNENSSEESKRKPQIRNHYVPLSYLLSIPKNRISLIFISQLTVKLLRRTTSPNSRELHWIFHFRLFLFLFSFLCPITGSISNGVGMLGWIHCLVNFERLECFVQPKLNFSNSELSLDERRTTGIENSEQPLELQKT